MKYQVTVDVRDNYTIKFDVIVKKEGGKPKYEVINFNPTNKRNDTYKMGKYIVDALDMHSLLPFDDFLSNLSNIYPKRVSTIQSIKVANQRTGLDIDVFVVIQGISICSDVGISENALNDKKGLSLFNILELILLVPLIGIEEALLTGE